MAAPGGWFTCRVQLAGPAEDGKIYIHLKDELGAFESWFFAYDSIKQEMLATALTAISTGFPVSAALTSSDEYSQIERLYIKQP